VTDKGQNVWNEYRYNGVFYRRDISYRGQRVAVAADVYETELGGARGSLQRRDLRQARRGNEGAFAARQYTHRSLAAPAGAMNK
jgi:hypothetical protein